MHLYKQEGKFGVYTISLAALPTGESMLRYLPVQYGDIWIHVKNNYGTIFIIEENMLALSEAFLEKSGYDFPVGWQEEWEQIGQRLHSCAKEIYLLQLAGLSNEQLWTHYCQMYEAEEDMWRMSIFIDALDCGYDHKEIQRIATHYGFSHEETELLLTPTIPSYVTEWEEALKNVSKGKVSVADVLEKFFWYRADYTEFAELTEEYIMLAPIEHTSNFSSPQNAQEKLLKKHNLSFNPLGTFQRLGVWREMRKRHHFTAIYGLIRLLREGLERQGINPDLAFAIFPGEARDVFFGALNGRELAFRVEQGVVLHYQNEEIKDYTLGIEAERQLTQLNKLTASTEGSEVSGMVACKGIVKGIARLVFQPLHHKGEFSQGDILVTSMTRPEFIPLMKRASAVVTNEGGISCHAAIVCRELGIPCVIGTKHATQVFQDGDQLEVDAINGVVKKVVL